MPAGCVQPFAEPHECLPAPLPAALSLACRMGINAQQKGEVGRCLVVLITGDKALCRWILARPTQPCLAVCLLPPPELCRMNKRGLLDD